MSSLIKVFVAYASATEQKVVELAVPAQTSVRIAIEQSGLLKVFPEINLMENKVGIYSKLVALDDVLHEDDRVEIYRALIYDPKQRRRLLVKK